MFVQPMGKGLGPLHSWGSGRVASIHWETAAKSILRSHHPGPVAESRGGEGQPIRGRREGRKEEARELKKVVEIGLGVRGKWEREGLRDR